LQLEVGQWHRQLLPQAGPEGRLEQGAVVVVPQASLRVLVENAQDTHGLLDPGHNLDLIQTAEERAREAGPAALVAREARPAAQV
jgi:hypothetical protein